MRYENHYEVEIVALMNPARDACATGPNLAPSYSGVTPHRPRVSCSDLLIDINTHDTAPRYPSSKAFNPTFFCISASCPQGRMASTFDVAKARERFPALKQDQVFLDNAGGSQALGDVIDS